MWVQAVNLPYCSQVVTKPHVFYFLFALPPLWPPPPPPSPLAPAPAPAPPLPPWMKMTQWRPAQANDSQWWLTKAQEDQCRPQSALWCIQWWQWPPPQQMGPNDTRCVVWALGMCLLIIISPEMHIWEIVCPFLLFFYFNSVSFLFLHPGIWWQCHRCDIVINLSLSTPSITDNPLPTCPQQGPQNLQHAVASSARYHHCLCLHANMLHHWLLTICRPKRTGM